ncbi:ATP-binding protein [Dongia sp.]|uniref:ATP-binding protein n=1 Tax=Dongia sp. TaxID=1977262 RepID=UPI0035B0C314
MRNVFQDWLIGLERMLPRSLLGRSILIIVTPIVLLQVVSAWVFYDSHWETVTRRLAQSVAGEIGAIVRMMPRYPTPEDLSPIFEIADEDMDLVLVFKPGEILPNDPTIMRQNLVDRQLARALESRVDRPFIIDSRSLEKFIEIHVQLADGVLHVVVQRRRLFSSTTYVFLLWMVGTSLALLTVATSFMRNQVKPIKSLAQAADDFGKGREVADFRTTGATEVVLAGQAFNLMRNRIRRQIVQRTEMLAGVSHDLRTPLTRMKLQLAMMGDGADIADLKKDVADMERMIGAYLAFARGEGVEQAAPTDITELVADVTGDARRHGADIEVTLPERGIVVPLRRDAFRRALGNVIGNAQRYAKSVAVTLALKPRHVEVMVDDDGPGIPPGAREDVFKPFFRLEQSRNQETGGTGLGLTIARDIVRGHGGDLELREAPGGGLRAVLRLPL